MRFMRWISGGSSRGRTRDAGFDIASGPRPDPQRRASGDAEANGISFIHVGSIPTSFGPAITHRKDERIARSDARALVEMRAFAYVAVAVDARIHRECVVQVSAL